MGKLTVYVGTTFAQFYLDKLSPIKGFIDTFIKKSLSEYEYDKTKHTYTFICDYILRDENTNSITIPLNFLPLMEDFLTACGYSSVIEEKEVPPITPREITIKPNPKWVPRDHQIPIIDYLLHDGRSRKGVSLATGGGKMVSNDTLVRVPGDWKRIDEVKVGDEAVASDGKAYPITNIYPHKNKQLYRVTFEDGRFIDAGAEHLWKVLVRDYKLKYEPRVLDTFDISALIGKKGTTVYVPDITPEDHPDVDLPIDPYMMGSLIANGCFRKGSVELTTPDTYVIDYFKAHMRPGYSLNRAGIYDWRLARNVGNSEPHYYLRAIEKLGLRGIDGPNKFIPEIYLKGSYKQRLELVRGLMDGDGGAGENHVIDSPRTPVYWTTSKTLADQLRQLIWSFGDKCTLSTRDAAYTNKFGERIKTGKTEYSIYISAKHPSMYHNCPTKKSRVNDKFLVKNTRIAIDDIQPIRTADATCIAVDSPDHTYVVTDYITTHNTFIANHSMSSVGLVTMIITASNIAQWVKNVAEQTSIHENFTYLDDKNYSSPYKWVRDINAQCKEKGSKLWLLMGSDSFYQLANDGVKPDVFICSTTTLREFAEGGESYKKLPWDYQGFLRTYGVGTKIVDEVHQNFHAINRIDLRSNIQNNWYLSATFGRSGIAESRIFNVIYPKEMQYGNSDNEPYTNVTVYAFRGNVPQRYVKRKRGYNAIKYEQYILKRPMWLKIFLENIVLTEVYTHYVRKRREGEKCLLFFSTKEMICTVRDYLNKELHKYGVVAKEKIGGIPDDVLNDPQYHIYIGTPGGMGTGRDIPGLRTAINFISVDSKTLIKQMFGRLRRIPDIATEWVDNVDYTIDSQVRHFYTRDRLYRKQAKEYKKVKIN